MVNYACTFNQSESGKYFEWTIMAVYFFASLTIIMATFSWLGFVLVLRTALIADIINFAFVCGVQSRASVLLGKYDKLSYNGCIHFSLFVYDF